MTEPDDALSLLQEAFSVLGHPDIHSVYRKLRAIGGVHHTPLGVIVLRRDLGEELLRDRRLGRVGATSIHPSDSTSPAMESANRMLVNIDPPLHTRIRRLVAMAFTSSRIEGLRHYVRRLVDERLTEAARRPSFDFIADLAFPLPVTVIGELIGIPEEDRPPFREWSRAIMRRMASPRPPDGDVIAADEATVASESYLRGLVADRRASPRDDLTSALVQAEGDGELLSDDEIVSNLNFLTMAGFETTVYTLGSSVLALLQHPDQSELLIRGEVDPRSAAEELLRFGPPLTWTSRVAREDLYLDGVRVPADTVVIIVLAAANRDPDAYSDPDRLDLRRLDPRPLSFGSGIHFCVGSALARLEIEEGISRLFTRYHVDLLDDPIQWARVPIFRGPATLNLHVSPL